MKANEVMKVLGICRQTLFNYKKSGKIKIRAKTKSDLLRL